MTKLNNQYFTNFIILLVGVFSIYFILSKLSNKKLNKNYEYLDFDVITANAQQTCQAIASKAADMLTSPTPDGASQFFNNISSFLNPKSYAAGENKSLTVNNQVINTDMSSNDITEITNSCSNVSTNYQVNRIEIPDTCEYCKNNLCSIENVKQTNENEAKQDCMIESVINKLLTKTNSIDSQALAQAMQKAQGILSGDNTRGDIQCGNVNIDMSSNDYMNAISNCANQASSIQENSLKTCGNVTNLIQSNINEDIQSCIINSTMSATAKAESDVKLTQTSKLEQTTTGIDTMASLMSIIVSIVFASLAVGGGLAVYYVSQQS